MTPSAYRSEEALFFSGHCLSGITLKNLGDGGGEEGSDGQSRLGVDVCFLSPSGLDG